MSAVITANASSTCLSMEKLKPSLKNNKTEKFELKLIYMTITYNFYSDFGNFRGDFVGIFKSHPQFQVLACLFRSENSPINAI